MEAVFNLYFDDERCGGRASHMCLMSCGQVHTGAILAPGNRTIASILRIMGLADAPQFQTYHRVLNRATWSSLKASRFLLRFLVAIFTSGWGQGDRIINF